MSCNDCCAEDNPCTECSLRRALERMTIARNEAWIEHDQARADLAAFRAMVEELCGALESAAQIAEKNDSGWGIARDIRSLAMHTTYKVKAQKAGK